MAESMRAGTYFSQVEQAPANAAPAIRGMRPHVDEVRVAYAIRNDAPGADDALSIVAERATIAGAEGARHLFRGSAVVEMVRGKIRLERRPVDTFGGGFVFDRYQHGD